MGEPMYTVQWKCKCGELHAWCGTLAMVHSQAGANGVCTKCGQWWAITDQGVIAIARPTQQFIDAEGTPL